MDCSELFWGLGMAGVYEIKTPGPGGLQASTHYPPQITAGQFALCTLAHFVAARLPVIRIAAADWARVGDIMAAMQALSKPFVGQKIECRSARQTQRVRTSLVVRASQDQQDVVVCFYRPRWCLCTAEQLFHLHLAVTPLCSRNTIYGSLLMNTLVCLKPVS